MQHVLRQPAESLCNTSRRRFYAGVPNERRIDVDRSVVQGGNNGAHTSGNADNEHVNNDGVIKRRLQSRWRNTVKFDRDLVWPRRDDDHAQAALDTHEIRKVNQV